jgi:hypothetical protein
VTRHIVEPIAGPGVGNILDLDPHRPPDNTDRVVAVHQPAGVLRYAWSGGAYTFVLLLVGIALGPEGLGILSNTTLSLLDPVVPVALAAIGVLAAFEIATPWPGRRLLTAASIPGVMAGGAVTAGTLVLSPLLEGTPITLWMVAIALGVCASTSSSLAIADPVSRSSAPRAVDLDALIPIVAGGVTMVAMRGPDVLAAVSLTAQLISIVGMVAVVGWLLLTRTSFDPEQRVFTAATVLLLGGVADYLSVSALMAGFIAGLCWHLTGGVARESIQSDLRRLQRPLVALVLLVAGARTAVTPDILALVVAYVLLRGAGKLAGSLACGLVEPEQTRGLASPLLSPGVLGVAFALNVTRAGGPDMAIVLSVAVLGTLGSQLLAGLRRPEHAG